MVSLSLAVCENVFIGPSENNGFTGHEPLFDCNKNNTYLFPVTLFTTIIINIIRTTLS